MGLVSQQSSVSGLEYWSQLGMLSGSGGIEVPKPVPRNQLQRPQIWPPLRCPRCDSANTKFCYYNNYSRSQPRYLCKACRRHWTEGGTLRNVPVGGGRKNKRNKATTSKAAAATTATATATAAATTAAATAINSSSIDDPATTIFPEILRRVLLRSPPPLLPPVASAGYGIMSTLMSSLQSDQIGNITAEPNTTVSSYGSALAQVSFFGYSDEGLGVMSSASNAWHVAPHAQPPPASSGGGEAVAAAPEASATTASGFWMSGWPDEEVSELDPSLTGDDL